MATPSAVLDASNSKSPVLNTLIQSRRLDEAKDIISAEGHAGGNRQVAMAYRVHQQIKYHAALGHTDMVDFLVSAALQGDAACFIDDALREGLENTRSLKPAQVAKFFASPTLQDERVRKGMMWGAAAITRLRLQYDDELFLRHARAVARMPEALQQMKHAAQFEEVCFAVHDLPVGGGQITLGLLARPHQRARLWCGDIKGALPEQVLPSLIADESNEHARRVAIFTRMGMQEMLEDQRRLGAHCRNAAFVDQARRFLEKMDRLETTPALPTKVWRNETFLHPGYTPRNG